MAGEQGIAYGAPSDGETPSTVYYRPYDSWASQSDWSVTLLPGEDALLVAAGGAASDSMGSVVVATSKGFVRFLSSSGIQRYVWRVGEEMVSIAAGREAVILVHREGGTSLDGTSCASTLVRLLTCHRVPELAIFLDRPGYIRARPRRSGARTEKDDSSMGRVHIRRRSSSVRFCGIVVRARPVPQIGAGEMGTTARFVHACSEGGETGVVLASRGHQHTLHLRDPQGRYQDVG